eukprot:8702537-Lingulodinium_polyedra.AAC.1
MEIALLTSPYWRLSTAPLLSRRPPCMNPMPARTALVATHAYRVIACRCTSPTAPGRPAKSASG